MPVYMHLANLIVPHANIIEKYEGGIEQFKIDLSFGSREFDQEDNELISFAAMNCDEFDIEPLIKGRLHYDKANNISNDFVIVSRYGGCL